MLTRLRHRAHGQEGFTLIELLVVILIIGILAAVAIPAFLNQKGKAQDANVKTDITTAQTAEETYSTNNGAGSYVAASGSSNSLTSIEPTLAQAMSTTGTEKLAVSLGGPATTSPVDPTGASGTSATVAYSVAATSPSKVVYYLTKFADGGVARTCDVSGASNPSGCSLDSGSTSLGTWGS
jgi:prepilin-type N-terminal cleavage/methylation domain-containing protein